MKEGKLFIAILSFVVIAELLSVGSVSASEMAISNSLTSKYYRIPVVTSDIANLALLDPKLMVESQLVLATTDTISLFDLPQTDERRFPNFDTLPGDPQYFAAHWSGSIIVPKDGDYRVTLSSHEASQLFINGAEIISVSPNDQFGGKSLMVRLQEGPSNVDVFFAKRSDFQSGLVFKIDDVKFTALYKENKPTANIISSVVALSIPTNNLTIGANSAPRVVYFSPPKLAHPGTYTAYKVLAQDTENSSLVYKLIESPQGMIIVPTTGLLLWKPTSDQLSEKPYLVVIEVSDGTLTTTSRFEISVKIPVTNSALSQNKTNNQVTGNLTSEPARIIFEENISVSDESKKGTVTSAGSQLSASVLFTGVFKITHWLSIRLKSIFYFFISMLLTGLVIYVFLEIIDRKKRNKNINHLVSSRNAIPKNQMVSQIEGA